jgi:putative heme-binding domain-containing protein
MNLETYDCRTFMPYQRTRAILVVALAAVLFLPPRARAAEPAPDEGIALLVQVLGDSDDPAVQLDILKGINAALEGRRRVQAPAGWAAARDKLDKSASAEVREQARALSAVFGDDAAFDALRKTLADAKAAPEQRAKALQSLLGANDAKLPKVLQSLLNDPAVREQALTGLAAYDDPATPQVILNAYPTFDLPSKRAALSTLASRPENAKALAAAVRSGKVPKTDLTAATARQLSNLADPDIDKFVAEVWGSVRTTPQAKLDEMAKFQKLITDERVARADPSRGRAVFAKTCAQCHTLYGEGGKVGPDLTGSDRANLDYFLQNVTDPSAIIAKEFQVSMIRTKDKRIVTGIATETDHAIRVVSDTGTVLIPKEEVDKVKLSELSMMPEGLLNALSEQDVLDLVAYLRTTKQVPLPGQSAGENAAAGAGGQGR